MLSIAGIDPKEGKTRPEWEKFLEERFDGKLIKYKEHCGKLQRISVWYTKGNETSYTVIFCINNERFELSFKEFINELELL